MADSSRALASGCDEDCSEAFGAMHTRCFTRSLRAGGYPTQRGGPSVTLLRVWLGIYDSFGPAASASPRFRPVRGACYGL